LSITQQKFNSIQDSPQKQDFDPIREYPELFPDKRPLNLPPSRGDMDHRITLIDPDKKINPPMIPVPEKYRHQLLEKLEGDLHAGRIYPSKSDQASTMFCVPKPDNPEKARFVTDLRQRNDNTVKDHYPIQHQDTIINQIARAKYRSKIDLHESFFQIRVYPPDEPKTAFKTMYGMYNSRVMQMGDANSSATLSRILNNIFCTKGYLGKFVYFYLDDIFIFSETRQEHIEHIRKVCELLQDNHLLANPKKSEFFSPRLSILGHYITDNGIHVDPEKVRKIKDWPTPQNKKDVERFTASVNYISQFLPHLSSVQAPITELTGKAHFNWTESCEHAFNKTKEIIDKSPVLVPISHQSEDPIYLFSDASVLGTGTWIGQGPTINQARPAAFHSRKFNSAQKNYSTYDQELFAIVDALRYFKPQLLGTKFTIVTDHEALKYLQTKSTTKITARESRWLQELSAFDFNIVYMPGSKNILADALSRIHLNDEEESQQASNYPPPMSPNIGKEDDNFNDWINYSKASDIDGEPIYSGISTSSTSPTDTISSTSQEEADTTDSDVTSLPVKPTTAITEGTSWLDTQPSPWMKKIATAIKEHPIYSKHLNDTSASPFTVSPSGLLFFIDSTLDNQPRMVIPEIYETQHNKTTSCQEDIINNIHTLVGHLGWKKTWERARQDYFWPTMLKDIKEYITTCDACQRNKSSTQKPAGLLHPLPTPLMSGTHLSMDFIGPLPKSKIDGQEYNSIMTITDRFSGWVWAIPTFTELTAEGAANLFFNHVYPYTSLPISIVSDRDTRFTSKFWKTLMELLNVKLDMSSAFHPQTDGSTERANKTIIQVLRNFVSTRQTDWAQHLTRATVAINIAQNETTKMSPFYVEHGRHPRSLPDNPAITAIPAVNGLLDTILSIQHTASKNITDARQNQTNQANNKRRPAPTYTIGQQVLLSMENIKAKTSIRSKLQAKWTGPYTITEYWPDTDNVRLELPNDWQVHNVFHTSLIKPYQVNNDEKFPSRKYLRPPPVPEADPQENIYEIEAIRDNKIIRKKNHYLVKWLGWPESDNQWVKESDMGGAKELIREYHSTLENISTSPRRSQRTRSSKVNLTE
jgi:hypothetical protein